MRLLRAIGRFVRLVFLTAVAFIPALVRDCIGLAGAGSVTYGAWLIYIPAGFIVGGILAVVVAAFLAARSQA